MWMEIGGYDTSSNEEGYILDSVLVGTTDAVAVSSRLATSSSRSSAIESWPSSPARVEAVHSLGSSTTAKKGPARQPSKWTRPYCLQARYQIYSKPTTTGAGYLWTHSS